MTSRRPARAQPSAALALALLMNLALAGCASYGFRARPQAPAQGSPRLEQLTLSTLTAPASRQLDVRLATEQLIATLTACGASVTLSPPIEATAHLSCEAERLTSRGAGNALWAELKLSCIVSEGAALTQRYTQRAARALAPSELAGATLAQAQSRTDTDTLLEAIELLGCAPLRFPEP